MPSPHLPVATDMNRGGARSAAIATGMFIGVVAYLIHPAASIGVFAVTLTLTLTDWRLARTTVLGLLLISTVLISGNYRLAVPSPIDLTAIRLAIAVLFAAWAFGQLDIRTTWPQVARRVNRPMGWLFAIGILTLVANIGSLAAAGTIAGGLKRMAALAGFIVAYSLVVALVRCRADAVGSVEFLVALGVVGSAIAVVERLSGSNPVSAALRALSFEKYQVTENMARAGGVRAYGTAAHPIEFGAMMSLLLPLALYLLFNAHSNTRRMMYSAATAAITVGMVSSVSRSSIIAAAVGVVVLALLSRPSRAATLIAIAVGAAALLAAMFPDATRTLRLMLDPDWIAREEAVAYSGRMQDWPIVWEMVKASPLIGVGYDLFDATKFFFLDNQYLKFALELGALGLGAVVWLSGAVLSLGFRAARNARKSEDVPLEAALLGSATSFVLLGFLFDTFGFFQITTLFFVLVGLLVVLASDDVSPAREVLR